MLSGLDNNGKMWPLVIFKAKDGIHSDMDREDKFKGEPNGFEFSRLQQDELLLERCNTDS